MEQLTRQEAFAAMVRFLERFYERTGSDDVGGLLGAMRLLDDGGTADPALWYEWEQCVREILQQVYEVVGHEA